MSTETRDPATKINGLEIGQDSDSPTPRTPESIFLKRRERRRLDLRSLAGTARESAKTYRAVVEGRISLGEAEVRSRMLRRHSEILGTVEQQKQLAGIQEQLEALRIGESALLPRMDGDSVEDLEAAPDGHGDEVQS